MVIFRVGEARYNPFAYAATEVPVDLSEVEDNLVRLEEVADEIIKSGNCEGEYPAEATPAILLLQSLCQRVTSSMKAYCLLIRNRLHGISPSMVRNSIEVLLMFQNIKEHNGDIVAVALKAYNGSSLEVKNRDMDKRDSFSKMADRFGGLEGVPSLRSVYGEYSNYVHLSENHLYGNLDTYAATAEKVNEWSDSFRSIGKAVVDLVEEEKVKLRAIPSPSGGILTIAGPTP